MPAQEIKPIRIILKSNNLPSYCVLHQGLVRQYLTIGRHQIALCDECLKELRDAAISYDKDGGEQNIMNKIKKEFPDHIFSIGHSEDGNDIAFVRLFDIPDEEVMATKEKMFDILQALEKDGKIREFKYLPSIVSHSMTIQYYPDCVCNTVA